MNLAAGQSSRCLSPCRRARAAGRYGAQGGFTLLELLVSVFLVVLAVSIAGMAMRLGYRSVEAGERKMDVAERFRSSLVLVVSQIESEIPLVFEEDGEKKSSFQGNGETVRFATNCSIWDGRRGYVKVRYTVESDENGRCFLTASEEAIGMGSERETKLFDGLDGLSFEYFYKDATEEGRWVSEWPVGTIDTMRPPDRMRVNLSCGAGKYALVVPMRSGTSGIE